MHLEIPNVPFAGCAMDCIGPLPATSKGNRHILTFICLLISYLIMVTLKSKMADEVSMAYVMYGSAGLFALSYLCLSRGIVSCIIV